MNDATIRYILLTYYKDLYNIYFDHSFFKKLSDSNNISYSCVSIFDFIKSHNIRIDSKAYGSHGMLMRFDSFTLLYNLYIRSCLRDISKTCFIHPSPSGISFNNEVIRRLVSKHSEFVFLCSRYEGIDARIISYYNFIELSIGDYILYDGDTASMVILNAITRYIFVNKKAKINESFDKDLLEHEQYTKPEIYLNMSIPPVYRTGNHRLINKFNYIRSLFKTSINRNDLYLKYNKFNRNDKNEKDIK